MSDELFNTPPSTGDALANARAEFDAATDQFKKTLAILDERRGIDDAAAHYKSELRLAFARDAVMREELRRLHP